MNVTKEWLSVSGVSFGASECRTAYARLRNYTVEFCEWGTGQPIILVPGLAGGYGLLGPLAHHLANDYRVISYQLRGEDDCFELRRRFDMRDLVEDLSEFIDWQCLEAPIVLGVSFGGVLAMEFAARYPSKLSHLIVQGASSRFERSLLQRVAGWVLSSYPLPANNAWINQFFNLLFGRKQKPGPLFEFVTRQCWQTDQSVMAHRFRLVVRNALAQRLRSISVPTLILTGDRDLLVSERSLQELAALVPQAEQVRLRDCGHLAFVTDADRVAAETCKFLACI